MASRASKNLAMNLARGAGNIIKKVVKLPMKAVDSYLAKSKQMDAYKQAQAENMMKDNGMMRDDRMK